MDSRLSNQLIVSCHTGPVRSAQRADARIRVIAHEPEPPFIARTILTLEPGNMPQHFKPRRADLIVTSGLVFFDQFMVNSARRNARAMHRNGQ